MKRRKLQLNLSNSAPTVTVTPHTFSGISSRINHVLDIWVTQLSKLPINLRNWVRSTIERGVHDSAHTLLIPPSNLNCFRDLGPYGFTEWENYCIAPFEAVSIFSISYIFKPSLFDQLLRFRFFYLQQAWMYMRVWFSKMVPQGWGSVYISFFVEESPLAGQRRRRLFL